jgi:hypothetical protein
VLPFLLNPFVHASRSLSVAWFGREAAMFRLFHAAWKQMEFYGPVLIPQEFAGELGVVDEAGVEVTGLVEVCERAAVAVVDFARRAELGAGEHYWRYYRFRHALAEFANQEWRRLEGGGVAPRRVVVINAIANEFEPIVDSYLDDPLTPFCARVRSGFIHRRLTGDGLGAARARNNILVMVPSRSRPRSSTTAAESFLAHSTRSDLLFILDGGDPELAAYPRLEGVLYEILPRSRRMGALNHVAANYNTRYDYFAVVEDDIVMTTPEWDRFLVEAIADHPMGIVLCNQSQEEPIPSITLMNTSVARSLGYILPPGIDSGCRERFWQDLGQTLGTLRYRNNVMFTRSTSREAERSPGRDPRSLARDCSTYDRYLHTRFDKDVRELTLALNAYWHPYGRRESDPAPTPAAAARSHQPDEPALHYDREDDTGESTRPRPIQRQTGNTSIGAGCDLEAHIRCDGGFRPS